MIRRMIERLRGRPEDTPALLARATKLAAKQRYLEAATVWREIADRSPRDGKPLLRLAESLLHAQRTGDALEAYRRAIHVFLRAGRRQAAAAACGRIVELNPDDAVAAELLATLRTPEARPALPLRAANPGPVAAERRETPVATVAASWFEDVDTTPLPLPSELPPPRDPSPVRVSPAAAGFRELVASRRLASPCLPKPLPGLPGPEPEEEPTRRFLVDERAALPAPGPGPRVRLEDAWSGAGDDEVAADRPDELMPSAVFEKLYGRRDAMDPELEAGRALLSFEGDDEITLQLDVEPLATDPRGTRVPSWREF